MKSVTIHYNIATEMMAKAMRPEVQVNMRMAMLKQAEIHMMMAKLSYEIERDDEKPD